MDSRIIIDIDCLLDTRMGVITQHSLAMVEPILEADYRSRVSDNLTELVPSFNDTLFKMQYEQRNVDTLKESRITGITPMLIRSIDKLHQQAISSPMGEEISIVINLHRYKEMTEEEKWAMVNYISSSLPPFVGVEWAHLSLRDLSPTWLKESKVSSVIMYDFNGWIEQHQLELGTVKIPNVDFIVPALYLNKEKAKEQFQVGPKRYVSGIEAVELSFLEVLSVVMTDIKYFSIIDSRRI